MKMIKIVFETVYGSDEADDENKNDIGRGGYSAKRVKNIWLSRNPCKISAFVSYLHRSKQMPLLSRGK